MKRRIFRAFICACFISGSFVPSVAHSETLREAVALALQNHPSVEAALADQDVAREEENEERAGFFPDVSATATGGRILGDNSTSRGLVVTRGEAYSYLWEGNAAITQPIFDGLETFRRVDAARARVESLNYTVSDVRENLGLRAVQTYLNVLRSQKALSKTREYKKTLQDYQNRIRSMVDQGAADESEAAQAKNISLLLDDTLIDFEGQLEASRADYMELMGHIPDETLSEPAPPVEAVFQNVDEAVTYASAHHPLILSSQKEMEAADHATDAEKGTLYPDLDGELSYLKKDQAEELGGEVTDARAIMRMSWEFSLGGADLARVRKSKAEYSQALAKSRESRREVVRDVRTAYAELETARSQLDNVKQREKITSELFETYEAQFEGARVSLLQLMQAENQMFNTQLARINAHYRVLGAEYGAMAAMGRLQNALALDNVNEKSGSVVYPERAVQSENVDPVKTADMLSNQKTTDVWSGTQEKVYPDTP